MAAPAVALAVMAILALTGMLATLDRSWHDLLQRRFALQAEPPAQTALILVDEQSLQAMGSEAYGMRWPWPRKAFAGLFAALHRAGAKAVVADFIFFEHSDSAEQDALLGAVSAGVTGVTLGAVGAQLPVFWPEEFRQAHPALFTGRLRWGSVQALPDRDSVIRRYAGRDSLVASTLGIAASGSLPKEARLRWLGDLEQLRTRGVPVLPAAPFVAAGLELLGPALDLAPDLEPAALVRAIEAQPAPAGEIFDAVRGRVVFVGANAAGTFDAVATPVHAPEPGVMVHWTAYANALRGEFLRDAPPFLPTALLLLVVAWVAWSGRRGLGLRRPGLATLAGAVGALGGSLLGFDLGVWFPPALPTVGAATVFSAVAVASFRLERARKREIQGWFGAYVSPAVVKRLVEDPNALKLGGERRVVTVFFSDLVGFTALSEKLPAERLVQLVNLCLDEFSGVLLDHGAYVDKYIGDAIMGVFGTPDDLPDHALAACRAALDCNRRLVDLNVRLQRDFGVTLSMRIGLNTGEVVVGNVGSSRKKNYTALGDAVNLAARLESANKAFGTTLLIGPATAAAVLPQLLLRPVAKLRVKGKTEAVEVFEPLGERSTADEATRRFAEASTTGFAAFVAGRFDEALRAFQEAGTLRPDDVLTTRFCHDAQRYASEGTPPGWQPVISLDTK